MTNHSIKGKTALVTGGANNLGALIATQLAERGAKAVAIHYHRDGTKDDAEKVVAALRKQGCDSYAFQGDLTSAAANTALFADAGSAMGSIDIAINTCGMVLKKPIIETEEEEYDRMFAINSKAAFFFLKEAGKELNDNGKICTIVTSLLGAFTPFYSTYAGAKSPVEHFTRAAAQEFGARGISVTAVGPGPMDTPFFYPAESKEAQEYHKSAAALSDHSKTGLTDIEDVVPFILNLVSDGWWVTGQTILINGGYTTK